MAKGDGSARLYYNLPVRFELVQIGKQRVKIPGDAQEEASTNCGEKHLSFPSREPAGKS